MGVQKAVFTTEELLMLVEKAHADRFIPADRKKEKVISNAIKSYASDCRREDVAAVFDRTVTGNGKSGFLLARNALYGDNMGRFKEYTKGGRKIPFEEMVRFYRLDESKGNEPMAESIRKSFYRFEYEDGSDIVVYLTDVYSGDVIPLIRAILDHIRAKTGSEGTAQSTGTSHAEIPAENAYTERVEEYTEPQEAPQPEVRIQKESEEVFPAETSGQSDIEQQQAEIQRQIQQLMRRQEELNRQAEAERRRAEEEARRKAEEERRQAEEEARRKAEEERRRAEEARRKAEEERRRAEEEARRKAEEERRREEEARRKAEEERRRAEEEARRKAEEERRRAEEEARAGKAEERKAAEQRERELAAVFDQGAAACARQDYAAAVPYFEKAAMEYGYVPAMENLGYMYTKKEMLGERPDMAEKWLEMAAEHGSKKAAGSLELLRKRDMYKIRLSHRRDADVTRPLLAKMSFNDAFILWRKGQDALEDGEDPKKAFQLVNESLPGRLSQTKFTLGMMYRKGLGVPVDKAKADELFGSLRKEDQVIFGRYPQTEKGMECEIAWKVLHVDTQRKRLFLFSEKVLDIRVFQPTMKNFDAVVNGADPDRVYDSKKDGNLEMKMILGLAGGLRWDKSEIRKWLNGLFVGQAFRSYEEEMLCETDFETLYNVADRSGRFTTRDRVSLLSLEEFIKYIGNGGDSITEDKKGGLVTAYRSTREDRKDFGGTTAYSERMEELASGGSPSDGGGWWWLRTPGDFPGTVMCGLKESLVLAKGNYTGWKRGGVRPVIWITWE